MTTRACALEERRLNLKYPLRVALNAFATHLQVSSTYLFPYVASGSIIVSTVLSLATVRSPLLRALMTQDMFLGGTIILPLGVLTVVGVSVSDLLFLWIDPGIRVERM